MNNYINVCSTKTPTRRRMLSMQDHYGKGKICSYTVGALPEEELLAVLPQGFLQMWSSQQIGVEGNLRTREGCFRRITVGFSM